jgi:predicted short-subunit dehydrogenase-like oxidoreductase (DUF2520 family)
MSDRFDFSDIQQIIKRAKQKRARHLNELAGTEALKVAGLAALLLVGVAVMPWSLAAHALASALPF